MSKQEWIDPVSDHCPKCGELVEQCEGVLMYAATNWEPAEYGCRTLETNYYPDATTVILKHTDADGNECSVGEDNTEELCHGCAIADDPDYYDCWEPDEYDDWVPDEPLDWMVTESAR